MLPAAFCAGLLVCGSAALAKESVVETPEKTLLVGVPTDYFPYSFAREDGTLDGFSHDLIQAIAHTLHFQVKEVPMLLADGVGALRNGRVDMLLLQGLNLSDSMQVRLGLPYLTLQGVMFVREGERRFKSLEDLKHWNAKIAAGPVGARYAIQQGIDAGLIRQESTEDALRLLAQGEVEVSLLTRLSGVAQARRLGLANLRPVGYPLTGYTVRFSFATRAQDEELLAQLNEGLAVLLQSGEFARIHDRWFAAYDPPRFTWHELISYVASALALALVVAIWSLLKGRQLQSRILHQSELLAESHAILAEAQHFARLGHWQHREGAEAPIVWSEETYRILEREPAAGPLSSSRLSELLLPADRVRWLAAMGDLERKGLPFEMDVVFQFGESSLKTLQWRGRPVFNQTGGRMGVFGTIQDVSERRAAEEALRRSGRLLRALYETIPLGLGLFEKTPGGWLIVAINPEAGRQLGLQKERAVGFRIEEAGLAVEEVVFWTQLFEQSAQHGGPLRLERLVGHGRKIQSITLVSLASGAPSSEPQRVCFLVEDVSERRHKDAEIEQGRRLRAVGELVGGIAHEFNNLLTPILLNADRIQSRWAHLPELSDEVRMISDAARRSAELTRRLLAFGRKNERRIEVLDLHESAAANVELVRHVVDRRIRFDISHLDGLPPVEICGSDLHQVLLNLLLNARDAIMHKLGDKAVSEDWSPLVQLSGTVHGPGDFVPIDLARSVGLRSWVRITVRDNGCGMRSEVVERMFEPFFTTKPVGQGTGLGLATVWHLVSEMGGRVDVESVLGEGTSFHVCLPVRETKPLAAPAPEAIPSSRHPRQSPPPNACFHQAHGSWWSRTKVRFPSFWPFFLVARGRRSSVQPTDARAGRP